MAMSHSPASIAARSTSGLCDEMPPKRVLPACDAVAKLVEARRQGAISRSSTAMSTEP
jgi:hypothetical protein